MPNAIQFGLFFPLAGFLGLIAFYKALNRVHCRFGGLFDCFGIFLCFLSLLFKYSIDGWPVKQLTLFHFIPLEGFSADFTLHFDSLSCLMALIITGVGFLIHVYSIGYMEHEEDFARYFAFLNFFVFSMLLLVLAGHLLVLFVGWEGVGFASYLLIGFWYSKTEAAQAATKAFVVNRIGDLGLLLGLILTFYLFGTGDIAEYFFKRRELNLPSGRLSSPLRPSFILSEPRGNPHSFPSTLGFRMPWKARLLFPP